MQIDSSDILSVCASHDLPVTAMQHVNSISFYRNVDLSLNICTANNYQYLKPSLELIGVYSGPNHREIRQVKWVPHLCQLLLLHSDGSMSLVSSSLTNQLLFEMTTSREFQDFKQIWKEQVTLNNGKITFSEIVADILRDQNLQEIIDFEIVQVSQVPTQKNVLDRSCLTTLTIL